MVASTSPLVTEPEICEMRGLVILPKRDALPLAFTWLGLGLGLGLRLVLKRDALPLAFALM